MEKYFSKIVAFIMILVLVLTVGCSGNSNDPGATSGEKTPQPKPEQTETPAEKPDPYTPMSELVTLTTGGSLPSEPKYPEGDSIESNDVLKWIKENMNIDIKYEWTTGDQNDAYNNKVNLLIASDEIPDFLMIGGGASGLSMLKKMGDSEMIQDVTPIYEDYASPTLKEMHGGSDNIAMEPVTYDGKLMAIPGLSDVETAAAVIWYRQDLLDKAGLQAPKTVDDVINVVKTLNEKGITNEAVLPGRADGELLSGDTASFDWLFSAYNAYPGMWIEDKDGSAVYGSVQPEVKAALLKAQEMYKEGILAKDFALMDGNKAVEAISSNKVGIFMGAWWSTWWPLQDSVKNDPSADWRAALIVSDDGNYYQRGYSAMKSFCVIKKGVEHPEAVMKLININEDNSLKKNEWYNELVWNDNAKYKETAGALLPPFPGAKYLDEISRRYNAVMEVVDGKVKLEDADLETANIVPSITKEKEAPMTDISNWSLATSWTEGAATFAKVKMIQKIPAYDGTTETYMKNRAILIDLEKQTFLKIIMDEAPIDEFDNFVGQWNKLGGDIITKEVNDIVD